MTRQIHRRTEQGVALPVALFALVVVAALVTGMLFTARAEVRGGESVMSGARAMEAAQAGLQMGWPLVVAAAGAISDGQTVALPKTQLGTTGSYYQDSVTRLNRFTYLLRSYGTYEVGGSVVSTRAVAMLVKRLTPELDINTGMSVNGPSFVTGSVYLDGHDQAPPGWTCPLSTRFEPGMRAAGGLLPGGGATIVGPAWPGYTHNDTTVKATKRVMDTLFFQLAGQADKSISATTINLAPSGDPCAAEILTNWGEPDRASPAQPCEEYFPVVYLNNGNPATTYTIHGEGQGVLLVNGDLKFNGNSHYAGLILVRGTVQAGSGTINIDGSVISLGLNTGFLSGNMRIDYSTCAVNKALDRLSMAQPLAQRGMMHF